MTNPAPPIRSHHEYVEYLQGALSCVRCLLHLSRKHGYLVGLDKQMSRCWNTSINGRVPSDEDREACAKSIGAITEEDFDDPIMPAMRAMVPVLWRSQEYFEKLPLPPGQTPVLPVACPEARCRCENPPGAAFCKRCGAKLPTIEQPANTGWALPSQMVHGEVIAADLRSLIDDTRCLTAIAPEDELFKFLWEQIQIMARFSRESVLPCASERAQLKLTALSADDLQPHIKTMLGAAIQKLRTFSMLYVNYPCT
jgi:hypothetical protein